MWQNNQVNSGKEVTKQLLGSNLRETADRKSTRLNSSHDQISYAVFCLKKKKLPTVSTWKEIAHTRQRPPEVAMTAKLDPDESTVTVGAKTGQCMRLRRHTRLDSTRGSG